MRGTKPWIAALSMAAFFFILNSKGFTLPDYTKTRGDFKLFFIGDSRKTVMEKLTYLEDNGEITEVSGSNSFLCETFGEKADCSFYYKKNLFGLEELRQIIINFYEHESAPDLFETEVKAFTKYIQLMLEKTYGTPRYVCPYIFLPQIKENKDKYLVLWELSSKIVGIAVTRKQGVIYSRIIINSVFLENDIMKELKQDFN